MSFAAEEELAQVQPPLASGLPLPLLQLLSLPLVCTTLGVAFVLMLAIGFIDPSIQPLGVASRPVMT